MRKTCGWLVGFGRLKRYAQIAAFLAIQEQEARWWRDASIAYFQSLSNLPLPEGAAAPPDTLAHYESFCVPYVEGSAATTPACPAADVEVPR